MRILSLYYTDKPGGFCKRLYRLLGALAARGHEVHFLALGPRPGGLPATVHFQAIPFLPMRRKGLLFWLSFSLWAPLFTAWQARRLHPQRLAVFGAYYSAVAHPGALLSRAPIVLFIRSLVFEINRINREPRLLRLFSSMLDRQGLRAASRVICMSNSMQERLASFSGRPLAEAAILPNDIPAQISAPRAAGQRKEQELTLLTSGVLDQRKNVQFLLDALAELKRESPRAELRLIIAGIGPLLEDHRRFAADHDLQVEFPGWVSSIEALYPSVDLVVHPSLHEGVSNSVLEALGAGLPVLAAETPEMRELLGDEKLLFSLKTTQALKTSLQKILASPEELDLLAAACRQRAELFRFDWDEAACELVTAQPRFLSRGL